VTEYDGARKKVQDLLRGYDQAFARFGVAAKGRDPGPAFQALFESVNWAHALDEVIGEVWQPRGLPQGFEWRRCISGGEVMDGVRFVRNRLHHQWADALRLDEGRRYPRTYPLVYFSWVWRPVEDLPTPDPRRSDQVGRAAYAELLAGHSAEGTLIALTEVFARVEAFVAPPELERRLGR
jgi:hypothetical protein